MTIIFLVGIFLLLVTLGMPIAFSLILASAVGIIIEGLPSLLVAQQSFIIVNSYVLMAIPFFILAGELMSAGGLTQRIVDFANSLIGHVRGGLAQVNVVGSAIFAGLSGSSVADTAAIGAVMVPAMLKEGYSKPFTIAVTCASGCVGPIIPPSIFMIIYGALTGVSIARLFLGGIIPGLLIVLAQMALCYYYSYRGEGGVWPRRRAPLKEVGVTFNRAAPSLVLPAIVLGGIVFGVFTPTEAGIAAVIYAIGVGFLYKALSIENIGAVFYRAIYRTSQVMLMLAAAGAYAWLLARSDFGQIVIGLFLSITNSPLLLILMIVLALAIISCVLDALPAMVILVPVFYPLGLTLGFDPTHFAMVIIVTVIMGGITPPVAPLLYIASAIARGQAVEAIKATLPFLFVSYFVVLLMILFPPIVTFLPNMLGP